MTATPETVKAAFTKENNVFAEINVKYVDPILNFADRKLFALQMYDAWKDILGLSRKKRTTAPSKLAIKALEELRSRASARAPAKCSTNSSAKTASAS